MKITVEKLQKLKEGKRSLVDTILKADKQIKRIDLVIDNAELVHCGKLMKETQCYHICVVCKKRVKKVVKL